MGCCAPSLVNGHISFADLPSMLAHVPCVQMVYGRTPFADLPFIPKMHAICNPGHSINFPPCANPMVVDVMRVCLDRDPRTRVLIPVSHEQSTQGGGNVQDS